MRSIFFGLAFLGFAAYGTTITGSIRNSYSDNGVFQPSLSTTLTLTDGVQTLSLNLNTLVGLAAGGCRLGSGVTGQCTFDPSFTTNINSFLFSYFSPGGGTGETSTPSGRL